MTLRRASAALLAGALIGCALLEEPTPPPRPELVAFRGDPDGLRPLERVVFLPLADESGYAREARGLGQSLRAAVAKHQLFEVLAVTEADLGDIDIASTRTRGVYRTEDLILVSRRFGADGALYGVVTDFRAYPSLRVGIRLVLLDCRTGRVPWAAESLLDAADRAVDQDVHNFHDVVLAGTESLSDYRRVLESPRLFGEYAAHRLAATLDEALTPPTPAEPKARLATRRGR